MIPELAIFLFCMTTFGAQAPSADLWSLKPITNPPLPKVTLTDWCQSPVDFFVLAKLEKEKLEPNPEADPRTLIRRVTFDLIGLPPTPVEIETFLSDPSPNAYENLVDRLLASPHYGERWARHWLDVVRYTESQGFEYDHLRPNAWHYRDYVINAFNSDKPYNQFVAEQIAGDVLNPDAPESIVATSLLVCGPWDQAGSSQANVTQRNITREEELEDLISAVSQGILGITVNCARCHSHKFDPVPQTDYYRIKSVFEGVRHGERPIVSRAALSRREAEISALKERFPDKKEFERETKKLKALPVSYVGTHQQPVSTHLLKRGDVNSPGDEMRPGGLSAIRQLSADFGLAPDAPEAERRRKFGEWLVDSRNPLTPRVIVNRLWAWHFGQGLVSTPSDFGNSGGKPSHPELLDFLAANFMNKGWSIKAVQRMIVCSAAYRQSSDFREDYGKVDSDNQWLWRFKPRRLEAESVRDAMLAAGDGLNVKMGGPSFRPFDVVTFNSSTYVPRDSAEPEFNRRSVYRMNVNSGKDPLLDTLDCPDPSVKTPRRMVTMTPLQALSLMNNSFVQRQADLLAQRVNAETGSPDAALQLASELVWGRSLTPSETNLLLNEAKERGLNHVCWAILNSTEFLYVR